MLLTIVHIGPRAPARDSFEELTQTYLQRAAAYARCESAAFKDEKALFDWAAKQQGRTAPVLVLLDSRGRAMTSEKFAQWLGARRDDGAQSVAFAVGPASGWTEMGRAKAQLLLSLGSLTLPHAMARLVMAEQIYRACTILAGHPYHTGH